MRQVLHPGPAAQDRIVAAPARGREIELEIGPGVPLEHAVARATAEFDSAWLEIETAAVSALAYVIPDHSPDAQHVAWYSDTHSFDQPGVIDQLGMIVGAHRGASFVHGHGLWTPRGGAQAMGHLLARQTVLAEPAVARGVGLHGARFERGHDAETNFELFQVHQTGEPGAHAAVRILPNQDLTTALDAACAQLDWPAARVRGLGSLIGAQFEHGGQLDSLATEFLIRDARAGSGRAPDIVIVGVDGDKILSGPLARGENAVLITAELILSRLES